MTRLSARFSSFSTRDFATTYAPAVVIVAGLLWIAYVLIDPTPPKHVVMAAGVDGSAYQDFAERYRAILARHGIDLEIRTTEGSMQNLHGLATTRSDADVAFVQSGTTNEDRIADRRGLVSLGSLFVEPVWIFYREAALSKVHAPVPVETSPRVPQAIDRAKLVAPSREPRVAPTAITQLGELRGLTLNVGPKGSGGPRLARELLEINHVEPGEVTTSELDDTPAAMKLLDGSLDAAMFVTAPEEPIVRMLLETPGIKLFNVDQAEAYARRLPYLKHVVLPRGIVALDRDIPHEDINLIAPTATLLAKATTHPAIVELLVQAATEIHGGAGWFRRAGEFPNDQYTEVPVSPVAERYYKSGPPFLQRWLPFWLANVIERMGVILVPIVALIIPLSRVLPPLYAWRVRSRVYRWYGVLRDVEHDVDATADVPSGDASSTKNAKERATRRTRQRARLDEIERHVDRLVVPLSYASELYALKLHIDRVRGKLDPRPAANGNADEPTDDEPADRRGGVDARIAAAGR